jgi:hypothetical protein
VAGGLPELVGIIVAVLVVAVVVAMTLPPGAPAAADQAVEPVPSPTATATSPPSTPSAPPFASAAQGVLDVEEQLWRLRDELAAVLDRRSAGGPETAPVLRTIASTLTSISARIDGLATSGAPAAIVDALRDLQTSALDSALETLGISVRDDARHRAGARAVVTILGPLDVMAAELASAADLQVPSFARADAPTPIPSPP